MSFSFSLSCPFISKGVYADSISPSYSLSAEKNWFVYIKQRILNNLLIDLLSVIIWSFVSCIMNL